MGIFCVTNINVLYAVLGIVCVCASVCVRECVCICV